MRAGTYEYALLAKLVELWIPIQQTSADELVENAHNERWQDGKEDVVERKCPGFVNDLTGECILERVLSTG